MDWRQAKKVVIIGGASGTGLTTAQMPIEGGARVLVTGHDWPWDAGRGRVVATLRAVQAMSLLKSKMAVVTGGSSGIGRASAARFVEQGASPVARSGGETAPAFAQGV